MKTPTYDLMLLFDTDLSDDSRNEVLRRIEQTVAKSGSTVGKQDWGLRSLPYRINHKTDAYYYLIQFQASPETLDSLRRTLRITEGVLRFRIIKSAAPIASSSPSTPAPTIDQDNERTHQATV